MYRRQFLGFSAAFAAAALVGAGSAFSQDKDKDMRISGPFAHDNLAVYLVHGSSAAGPVPLTLQEALGKGTAQVYETGRVSELFVENNGSEALFIQAGDIVKGGQQDRVLTISLLVPAKSGRVPISSFCVEQGRWSARGREAVTRFASSAEALPSRSAKLAMKEAASGAPPPVAAAQPRNIPSEGLIAGVQRQVLEPRAGIGQRTYLGSPSGDGQGEIWRGVAETQRKLSENLAAAVASPQSATSLQLSLENQKLKDARNVYATALKPKGEVDSDVVGVVVAINGRFNSAEIYPSNGLFKKMWEKVLTSAATEAIGELKAASAPAPAAAAAKQFIDEAEQGKSVARELPAKAKLETFNSDKALYSRLVGERGDVYHRSLVARER